MQTTTTRSEPPRDQSRRTFLKFLAGTAAFVIPDWGQRVFPMYPRTHTVVLDDYMFLGQRLQLRLPWDRMEAYQRQLVEEASRTAIVRHALPDGRVEVHRRPNPHVEKTYADLLNDGWVPMRRPLDVDAGERKVGRVAICKRKIHVPDSDGNMVVLGHQPSRLLIPVRVLDRAPDGQAEWALEQKLRAGGMISGVWTNRREEASDGP